MQGGWIERSRNGWRGGWREAGRKRHTLVVERRGDARRLLLRELDRLARHRGHIPELTLRELLERFQHQHDASATNRRSIENALRVPLQLWGDTLAERVTTEQINRWIAQSPHRAATKQTYLRKLRQVYLFAVDNGLVSENPARRARMPTVGRSDRLRPFRSWDEVERVAEEAGRWGAFIIMAVDTGARPGELRRLEHRHVDGARVYLPGTKTRNAKRFVTLTKHGIEAYRSIPRPQRSPLVFHTEGRPLDLHNWRARVWHPALELAGLEPRTIYQMRHTFAFFSLMAGVPLSDLAVEMGHANITLTHQTYGHWSDEMGDRAARLRAAWAAGRPATDAPQMPHADPALDELDGAFSLPRASNHPVGPRSSVGRASPW
jgi:integrase